MLEFLGFLLKKSKSIVLMLVVGLIAILLAVKSIPNVYKVEAKLTLPTLLDEKGVSQGNILSYSREEMFRKAYDSMSSKSVLTSYMKQSGSASKLMEQDNAELLNNEITELLKSFSVIMLEPTVRRGDYLKFPTLVEMSLLVRDENSGIELLRGFLTYVNQYLNDSWHNEYIALINQRVGIIEHQLRVLREGAKTDRLTNIKKLKVDRDLKISKLKIERRTLISFLDFEKSRHLAELKEAVVIARSLGIEQPTTLDKLGGRVNLPQTNISISQQQSLPPYLMGTVYLSTLMKTLEERDDDSRFNQRIAEIDGRIIELNNDPEIKLLIERESDDPFVPEIQTLLKEKASLETHKITFNGVNWFTYQTNFQMSNTSYKPNKPVLAVVFYFLIVIIVLFGYSLMFLHGKYVKKLM